MVYQPPYTYLIDGIDVREWTFVSSNLMHLGAAPRSEQISIPGRSGNLLIPQRNLVLDAPILDLELAPAADSPAVLEGMVDRLQMVLMDPDLMVTRIRPYGDDSRPQRSVQRAELVSVKPDREDGRAGRWARWKVQLRLPEVAWRDERPKTVHIFPGLGMRVNGFVGTLPVEDIQIHARGPLTRLQLTDCQTLTGVTFTGDITEDETLTIDMDELTAKKTDSAGKTSWVTGGLDFPTGGRLILAAEAKTKRMRVDLQLDGAVKGKTDVALEGRRAWV